MSQKTEKKTRKMIREFILQNKEIALQEAFKEILSSNFVTRFAFAVTIVFKKKVR